MSKLDSNTTLIILSYHGHGMRPTKLVNINEILRKKGYLNTKIKKATYSDSFFLFEKSRRKVTNFINQYTKYGIGNVAIKFLHKFQKLRKLYTSPISIDWEKTMAYVSDLSGIKSYIYGGIIIRKANLKINYEKIREELYQGKYIYNFPDIVFELKDGYRAGWSIHNKIISLCQTHNIQPGSHKVYSQVFLIYNFKNRKIYKENLTLMDIAPTILDLLEVNTHIVFDGKSIFKN